MTTKKSNKKTLLHQAQKDIYFGQMMTPTSPLYNTGGYTVFKGFLDTSLLKKAIEELPVFFDIFSLYLDLSSDQPIIIHGENTEKVIVKEIDFSLNEFPKIDAKNWIQEQFDTVLELHKSRLYRFAILKVANDEYWWLKCFHHLIIDGFGFTILINHVIENYNNFYRGEGQKITQYPKYLDAIQKNSEYLASKQYLVDEAYWKDKYVNVPKSIVASKTKKEVHTTEGERFSYSVVPSDRELFEKMSIRSKASLSQFTIAALLIYLGKTTDDQIFSIGTPIHNRGSREERKTLGMFAAVLAHKGEYKPDQTVSDCIDEIRKTQRLDFRHRQYPVSHLNRSLKLLSENRQHIFDIIVNYEPLAFIESLEPDTKVEVKHMTSTSGLLNPLSIRWCDYGKEYPLELKVDYMTTYYNQEEIKLLVERLLFVIRQFEFGLDVPLSAISILPEKEKDLLLSDFNNTTVPYPSEKTVLDLFKQQVDKKPEAIAVVLDKEFLTYKELDEKSNQLAKYLLTEGLTKEELVPICLQRSLDLIVGVLGVLKAGGVYVPIDAANPQERIDFIIKDTDANLVLTQEHLLPLFQANKTLTKIICIDTLVLDNISQVSLESTVLPNQLMYVIYTSGTTGKPKGVLCEHKGLLNLALIQIKEMKLSSKDAVLQFASLAFDALGIEIYPSLLSGARIVMMSEEAIHSKEKMNNIFIENQVTIAILPTSYQRILEDYLSGFRIVISGGESLQVNIAKKLQSKGVHVFNAYGPTENSVCSTLSISPIKPDGTVSIGKPLSNTKAYILDDDLELVPIGVAGELCVSGIQLARGYLKRPDLTKEKFVEHPFIKEEILYKTGDIARWMPDGEIEFIGRKDDQVKIRGYRVELGEIENALSQIDGVRSCCVLAKEAMNGEKRLIGYVVLEGELNKIELETSLKQSLPNYMIPRLWTALNDIPLTSNGKLNKKSLPDPEVSELSIQSYVEPRNDTEEQLVIIWQELLGIVQVGVCDNFFELGGNSLLAIQLVSIIKKQLQQSIQVQQLFQYPTIRGLEEVMNSNKPSGIAAGLVRISKEQRQEKKRIFCAPGTGGNIVSFYELANLLHEEYTLYGFQAYGLEDITTAHQSIEEIASQNIIDMQRIDSEGPYLLAGYSLGANVTHEMALQLQQKGYKVSGIVSFDGIPYSSILGGDLKEQLSTSFSENLMKVFDMMVQAFLSNKNVILKNSLEELAAKTDQEQLESIYNRLVDNGFDVMDKSEFSNFVNMFLHQYKIGNSYNKPLSDSRYDTPVFLFKAKTGMPDMNSTYGWELVTQNEIIIYETDASHLDLLSLPHVTRVSDNILKMLSEYREMEVL